MLQAVEFGMSAVKELCEGLKAWQQRLGKDKLTIPETSDAQPDVPQQEIAAQLQRVYEQGLSKRYHQHSICNLRYENWLGMAVFRAL